MSEVVELSGVVQHLLSLLGHHGRHRAVTCTGRSQCRTMCRHTKRLRARVLRMRKIGKHTCGSTALKCLPLKIQPRGRHRMALLRQRWLAPMIRGARQS